MTAGMGNDQGQPLTSRCQIDIGKVVLHPREYFGVVGFFIAPLGEPQSAVQDRIWASLKVVGWPKK